MTVQPSYLILEDGSIYEGVSPDWQTLARDGEVVFTTGMTGYYESLTDPSYAGQHLVFTFPLQGNYGVPDSSFWESESIHASGVIVSEICDSWSHAQGLHSLMEWLKSQNVPMISGIDTRDLTKRIRKKGAMLGVISPEKRVPSQFRDPNATHLVKRVSPKEKQTVASGKKTVVALDCGMKENIMRCLKRYPVTIERAPYDYDFLNDSFDGIFISNGPGNPEMCGETVDLLRLAMALKKPIFGICLGAQILSLAAGAKTYKLPYGHRGHNQPCFDLKSKRCYITSQNHGYAIDGDSLPNDWEVSYINLNDKTVEGIRHKTLPFYAVQFHPEAAPGPTDTVWIFEEFINAL